MARHFTFTAGLAEWFPSTPVALSSSSAIVLSEVAGPWQLETATINLDILEDHLQLGWRVIEPNHLAASRKTECHKKTGLDTLDGTAPLARRSGRGDISLTFQTDRRRPCS